MLTAQTREQATEMGLYDQFLDLFVSTKKQKFLNDLYDFIHRVGHARATTDFSSIKNIIRDAPLDQVADFFSGKDVSGSSLLHLALADGEATTISAYRKFLELLSSDRHGELIDTLVVAKNSQGKSGLCAVIQSGDVGSINAYRSLMELLSVRERHDLVGEELFNKDTVVMGKRLDAALADNSFDEVDVYHSVLQLVPTDQRARLLAKMLEKSNHGSYVERGRIARDRSAGECADGLAMALENGSDDSIETYRSLLETIPSEERLAFLIAPNGPNVFSLAVAMKNRHASAIAAYKSLVELLPTSQRTRYLSGFLMAAHRDGKSCLSMALNNGSDSSIDAFRSLLQLLPAWQLEEILPTLLRARDKDGNPGLAMAVRSGNVRVVSAYKSILAMLSPTQRAAYLPELIEVRNRDGSPELLAWIREGRSAAIKAYLSLVELMPEVQRSQFLASLILMINQRSKTSLSSVMASNNYEGIMGYRQLFAMIPPSQRSKILGGLLIAKDEDGNSGLASALGHGRSSAIRAYRCLLELLPADQCGELLHDLIVAKDKYGNPGLAWALQQGHADAIAAYHELLDIIPAQQRIRYMTEIVCAKDINGIPGIVWAIQGGHTEAMKRYEGILRSIRVEQRVGSVVELLLSVTTHLKGGRLSIALENGDVEFIDAFRNLMQLVPAQLRVKFFGEMLLAKNKEGDTGLSLALGKKGNAEVIRAYKSLLELVPENHRDDLFTNLIIGKDRFGNPGLAWALQKNQVGAITAYTSLLELLPEAQRAKSMFNILSATTVDGTTGLAIALEQGSAITIRAYKQLLGLLPSADRSRLIDLLIARRGDGCTGLAGAIAEGNAGAIVAYKELLQLLNEDERRRHIEHLLWGTNPNSMSALMSALHKGNAAVIAAYEGLLDLIPSACLERVLGRLFRPQMMTLPGSASLDALFNHFGNQSRRSLLTIINNIDDRHQTIKRRLMVELSKVVVQLNLMDGTKAQSILDIWTNNPIYLSEPIILETIRKKFLDRVIESGNSNKLNTTTQELHLLMAYVKEITKKDSYIISGKTRGTFMLENNGFFIQLIAMCTNHFDPILKKDAEDLYDQYLDLNELSQHKIRLSDLGYDHGIKGSGDGAQLTPLASDDRVYLFVRRNTQTASYDGLIMSKDSLREKLDARQIGDWSNVALIRQTTSPDGQKNIDFVAMGEFRPNEVYPQFRLFQKTFQLQSQQAALYRFLELLNLRHTNSTGEQSVLTFDYTDAFSQAFRARNSQTKLTSREHQLTLSKIFARYLAEPSTYPWSNYAFPVITSAHIEAVLQNFRPVVGATNQINDARILFCLAAVTAKLNSSRYFGQEFDSPMAIRSYAAGLLRKAYELNPGICSQTQYIDFLKKMFGLDNAMSCTALLSDSMLSHVAQQSEFNSVLMAIKPVAWA